MRTTWLLVFSVTVTMLVPTGALGEKLRWADTINTTLFDAVEGVGIDGAGDVYVLGETDGTLPGQTSAGAAEVFLRKYTGNGTVRWTRQFGTPGNEFVGVLTGGLAVDEHGNAYAGGLTTGAFPGQTNAGGFDAFLRKYNAEGDLLWTRQFGTAGFDDIHDVALDGHGRVYVAGSTDAALPGFANLGAFDAVVRAYDADGNELWTRQFGTAALDHLHEIAVDRHGNIYVAGFTDGVFPGLSSAGGRDVLLRKYDRNGNVVWTRQFGTAAAETGLVIAVDDTGVFVAGQTFGSFAGFTNAGGLDAFVRKYHLQGDLLWTFQFGFGGTDRVHGIAAEDGFFLISGQISGALPGQTFAGRTDAFVRKYDPFAFEMWTQQFGGPAIDDATGIARDGEDIYVGGVTGGLPGPGFVFFDAFVRKISDDD